MSSDSENFKFIKELVFANTGIVLNSTKEYLVDTRLTPIALAKGLPDYNALFRELKREKAEGPLHREIIEAMMTCETRVFRDEKPFEQLKNDFLPSLIKVRASQRSLIVWSCACSSGQEPYSIAMTFREYFSQYSDWRFQILATDYSKNILDRAKRGQYTEGEVRRGLPPPLIDKYFQKTENRWEVKPEIRRMVNFMEMNLVRNFPPLPPADIVFLRNVLIYFDVPTKAEILRKISLNLRNDGYLLLGGAETTIGITDLFRKIRVGEAECYQKCG